MSDGVWGSAPRHTTTELLERRIEQEPDAEYLDVCGTKLTAAEVGTAAARLGGGLQALGVVPGDRVAMLLENSPEMLVAWWAAQWAGAVAVPINTAYKGEYLRHQLRDSGARVLVVAADLAERAAAVSADLDELTHVVITGEAAAPVFPGATGHRLDDLLTAPPLAAPVARRPSDLATFIYTGGTTGLSKGCMLSHNYHEALARQIGYSWGRTADDVIWTPLPMFHYNALVTAVVGTLVYGGRGAIFRRFSVSNFWPEMNRTGATLTSTLGTMAYLLAHDVDRPEMPRSGAAAANTSLRLMGAAPLPPEVDDVIRSRFGIDTFSGAYGVTEASLISWQPPGVRNRPRAAGIVNTEYFDVRIFDDEDEELPTGTDGEIVIRPKRAHVMFEGYWGRPEVTVETSRNWWYHTGDIGKIDADGYLYFVDRKADYLRRRGENIASFEVERVLMGHGQLADVAVHAVPSQLTEDDVKVTATRVAGSTLTEEELFRWCVDALPYFVLPRYIEFRDELPRSPVGRVLKRELRTEGVTPATWDVEAAGITYEKR
ncbi:AMP-binding protein [Pseudofrankia inefficax]|uniref:AMP-dependent synthetase and ligase n=1 Tax=Pseudofrankia inefficax (strain DSM 45817 / CECT 9037 / DDB 130130 / EuI1c) TaxID=298654 RepID=E3JC03_PSEI1|nr:AMP-binding protein [Pseudofrankia inefficax]ADP82313.1 AMP-dependent synthetase and ligase [Pseudofrankia inefficax]